MRTGRPAERDQVEQPRPSGLERTSRLDRQLRAAIERTAAALQSLNRESEATRQVVRILRQATANVRTNALIAGMGGGFIVALVGAIVAVLLLR